MCVTTDLRSKGPKFDSRLRFLLTACSLDGSLVCKQVNHLGISNANVNSAFHPSGVDIIEYRFIWLGLGRPRSSVSGGM